MATYSQWRASIDAGKLRRVTWVAGTETVLIDEIVDTTRRMLAPSEMDYVRLTHERDFERRVWAEANQFSFTPGANRLILVRDAEKLTRFDQLELWLSRTRQLPGVHLLFISGEDDLAYTGTGNKRTLKPHLALFTAPRGFAVRCVQQNEADALTWIKRRSTLDDSMARHLLTRTGGNLTTAATVLRKLALFPMTPGTATINALVTETPAADFSDNLIAMDKRQALLSIESLRKDDPHKITMTLSSRLDLLGRLHRLQIAGQTRFDVSGISPFLQRRYLPYARHYDGPSCTKRRRLLAVIDDCLRTGAREAVLEALVALW